MSHSPLAAPPAPPPAPAVPRLIAWEVTRSCPLRCRHCRAAAGNTADPAELTTAECLRVLDSIAAFAKPIVILTGGEPMRRADIYDIARHGTALGLRMVMAPCGQMVTVEAARRMIDAGIRRISLSIDGATAASHDAFRGVPGAFDSVMEAVRCCRAAGLEFQINTTVTERNAGELGAILDLAVSLGAAAFHPFLLVPTGRGKALANEELAPAEYERVLHWIHERSAACPIPFKPTCAPHYYRIVRQRERPAPLGHPAGLDSMTKGCMGGESFAFISHVGKVQICGFLDVECGDLHQAGLDFRRVWDTSEVFQTLRRSENLHGRCGYCEYRRACGGCRARAYAMTGDYLAEEPFCVYQPATAAPAL